VLPARRAPTAIVRSMVDDRTTITIRLDRHWRETGTGHRVPTKSDQFSLRCSPCQAGRRIPEPAMVVVGDDGLRGRGRATEPYGHLAARRAEHIARRPLASAVVRPHGRGLVARRMRPERPELFSASLRGSSRIVAHTFNRRHDRRKDARMTIRLTTAAAKSCSLHARPVASRRAERSTANSLVRFSGTGSVAS